MALLATLKRLFCGAPAPGDTGELAQAQQCIATADRDATASFSQDLDCGSATRSCPYLQNRTQPCDVERLVLSDSVSGRRVAASVPVARRPPLAAPPGAPARVGELSAQYDMVLELVADCASEGPKPPAKVVSLQIEAEYQGSCPVGTHPMVTLTPVGYTDLDEGPHVWQSASPAPVKLLARSSPGDKGGGPAKWLSPFWFMANDVKELTVEAVSCGVRSGTGAPTTCLNGLVRIYRNDVYTLSCTVPPFRKWKRERSASRDLKGVTESKSASSRESFGRTTEEKSSTTRADSRTGDRSSEFAVGGRDGTGYTRLSETAGTKGGTAYVTAEEKHTTRAGLPGVVSRGETLTAKNRTDKGEELAFELEPSELQLKISLKRNGHELDFTKFANDLINLHQRLSKAWNDIQNWVPKIGWSASFELSLLEGEISGQWGHRRTDKWRTEAYCWVERFYEVTFAVKVLSYRAEVSFGVDFSVPDLLDWFGDAKLLEVVLKAAGTISGEATLAETLTGSEPAKPVEIKGESKVELYVHGRVSALGYTYDAKGGVEGGIAFEGELVCSWEQCPRINGTASFRETKVYARFIDGVTGDHSGQYERVIFERKQIWQGSLPEVTT